MNDTKTPEQHDKDTAKRIIAEIRSEKQTRNAANQKRNLALKKIMNQVSGHAAT
jgi:hypothetical protein